jgi:hypothetical protein
LVCLGIQLGILKLPRIIPSWVGLVHPCGERGRVLQAVTSLSNAVVLVVGLVRDRQPRRACYNQTRRACCVWKERLSLSVSFLHGPIRSCIQTRQQHQIALYRPNVRVPWRNWLEYALFTRQNGFRRCVSPWSRNFPRPIPCRACFVFVAMPEHMYVPNSNCKSN